MTSFQKFISWVLVIIALLVWYYFVVALPSHNANKIRIQERELQMKQDQQDRENDLAQEEMRKDSELEQQKLLLQKEEACDIKGNAMKKEYNNIASVYFDDYQKECYVSFIDDSGLTQTIPVDQLVKKFDKPKPIPLRWSQTIIQWVNFREYPPNWTIIQVIDPTNKVSILSSRSIEDELWYEIRFEEKIWWISAIAFWQN